MFNINIGMLKEWKEKKNGKRTHLAIITVESLTIVRSLTLRIMNVIKSNPMIFSQTKNVDQIV